MAVTIPSQVFAHGGRIGDRPAFFTRHDGLWEPTSWAEYAAQVREVGRSLVALGIEKGDAVGILGFNRPEWVVFDIAAMAIGAVPAGIYTTNSAEECSYILRHARAAVVLVENRKQWKKIAAVRDELPDLGAIVLMRGAEEIEDAATMSWERFLEVGRSHNAAVVDEKTTALAEDDPATLIYTAAPVGPPKAVVLTHGNLAWSSRQAVETFGINTADSVLSYLPLSHIAEQIFTIHAAVQAGFAVYFAQSISRVRANLREVNPTIFFGVPRIWEGIEAGIAAERERLNPAIRAVVDWAAGLARRVALTRAEGRSPGLALALQYEIARRTVLDRIKGSLGFANVRLAVSGGAPIAAEVLESISGTDVVVREVYGLSETTGPAAMNRPGLTRFGSVGPVWPGSEIRIADDDEVLVRGRNVFAGYLDDSEATEAAFADGWLQTGDLGHIDERGLLTITGRKKDLIITSGGKNVAPRPIEVLLKRHAVIADAIVVGDRRDYVAALVAVDEVHTIGMEPDALEAAVQDAVDEVNSRLARVEQVRRTALLARQLTIEDGELTPAMKVRRDVVQRRYAEEIDSLYP